MVHTIDQQVAEIRGLLETRLRVRGHSLAVQVRKAGRALPRAVRRDLAYMVQSADLVKNPKLARMVDPSHAQRAHRNAVAYLNTINPRERRITAAVNVVASIALVLLVTGAVVLYVLVQRGFV
ncbi:hypothetical protein CLV80_102238 [Yoonia maritima]|uniref:Uncharacterized protein n=2 Tax=Yoonia maritima TaxID=1435347 RepID=A0A2T0W327_9RHOB|nr:hypothetical protein CLV80_102238 [Yoonia maritima]